MIVKELTKNILRMKVKSIMIQMKKDIRKVMKEMKRPKEMEQIMEFKKLNNL